MPRTDSSIPGITILENDSNGMIVHALSSGAPSSTATTANKFAYGCVITNTQTSLQYYNYGSVASPSWKLITSRYSNTTEKTIATTSNTDFYVIVPETGTVSGVDFSGIDALAANDTNYITFSITNLGQAGAGSTAILAASDANTTKSTGGTALAANTKRQLTLSSTAGANAVTAGDRLRIRAAATGTLANTVTGSVFLVRYDNSY